MTTPNPVDYSEYGIALDPHADKNTVVTASGVGPFRFKDPAPLLGAFLNNSIGYGINEDFCGTAVASGVISGWAKAETGTGTHVATDGAGGIFLSATGTTDNNDVYHSTANECFLFAADKPLYFDIKVTFAAGSTAGKCGFIAGVSDTVAADSLTDSGAVMSSFDGCVIAREEDASVFNMIASNATTQTETTFGTVVESTEYRLGFMFDPNDGTTGYCYAFLDGEPVGSPIAITLSGLAEMHAFFGFKTFEAAAATGTVDWVRCFQVR